MRVVVIADIGRPVIHARFAVRWIARIVQVERCLKRCLHGNRLRVGLVPVCGILGIPIFVSEKIACVIQHNVLDQIHATSVQRVRQLLVVFKRADVGVYFAKVRCPITVIAPITSVPPLVGHGRRNPHRSCAQALDVIEAFFDTQQIAATVVGFFLRVVETHALVVVSRIAILKTVRHEEINDLVAPIW